MEKVDQRVCQKICLGCGHEFVAETEVCPDDKTTLVKLVSDQYVGTVIGGSFEVMETLAGGAGGRLYKARQQGLERLVCIKVLQEEFAHTPEFLARFQREAKLLSEIKHANIASVIAYGVSESGDSFTVMEYIEGVNLGELPSSEITEKLLCEVIPQICDALETIHKAGVVHRDLKPSNIMVSRNPDGHWSVKLVDFGLVRLAFDKVDLTQTGQTVGSPAYMSPEQCMGHKVDGRADIYSLGCVLYRLVTKVPPFMGRNVFQIMSHKMERDPLFPSDFVPINKRLEWVIMQCLQYDPAHRFQTAGELRDALTEGDPVEAIEKLVSRAKQRLADSDMRRGKSSSCTPQLPKPPTETKQTGLMLLVMAMLVLAFYGYSEYLNHQPAKMPAQIHAVEPPVSRERVLNEAGHQLLRMGDMPLETDEPEAKESKD